MTNTLIEYSVEKGIGVIQLTNPPANAYSYEMFRQFDDAVLDARMNEDVHVIVVRGAGDKFFCAGADIAMLSNVTAEFKYYFCLHANETLLRLEHTPKLVIAAIGGHCVGGGLEVAMAADLRIAKRGKAKFGLPEVTLGVLPGTGGTQRLSRLIGKAKAIELMVTGDMMNADEALELGIVNRVFEAEVFWPQVMDLARSFCPPAKAAKAVGYIKRSVQGGSDLPLEAGLALERELQQNLFNSHDAKEGIAAYVAGKTPQFSGR